MKPPTHAGVAAVPTRSQTAHEEECSKHSDWLIGVDLGGTKIEVILMDRQSNEHFRKRVSTPAGDYRATLQTIRSLVLDAEVHVGASDLPVGIGMPGSVSGITGRVKNGNSIWINGQPLQEDLCALLRRPVTLTNDANCLALSEAIGGRQNHSVLFAAILGTGCGAGISVNGRILTGPNGVAGEWDHNPLVWPHKWSWRCAPTSVAAMAATKPSCLAPALADA